MPFCSINVKEGRTNKYKIFANLNIQIYFSRDMYVVGENYIGTPKFSVKC